VEKNNCKKKKKNNMLLSKRWAVENNMETITIKIVDVKGAEKR